MVERVRNVIKRDRKRMSGSTAETPQKRSKITSEQKCREILQKRYPTGANIREDQSSTQSHLSAMGNELSKAKPRDAVLLPLMKSTYPSRRIFVLNEAVCARQILDIYPALKRPTIVRIFLHCIYNESKLI